MCPIDYNGRNFGIGIFLMMLRVFLSPLGGFGFRVFVGCGEMGAEGKSQEVLRNFHG